MALRRSAGRARTRDVWYTFDAREWFIRTTNTEKGLVETFVDVVPTCEGGGPQYTITTRSNLIEHETTFDDGRVHATFTQTGTFRAVPLEDQTLPSFTGEFTTCGPRTSDGA